MVSILAGSALFFSGYSLGRAASADPGTPGRRRDCLPAVLGHLPHHLATAMPGAEVDQATIISGAIRGMIQSLNDPYSALSQARTTNVKSLLGVNGQFEGVRCRDRRRSTRWHEGLYDRSGRRAGSSSPGRSPAHRPTEGRRSPIGDVIVATDGSVRPRPDTQRGSRPGSADRR